MKVASVKLGINWPVGEREMMDEFSPPLSLVTVPSTFALKAKEPYAAYSG